MYPNKKETNINPDEAYAYIVHEISNSMSIISKISQQINLVAQKDQSNGKSVLELSEKLCGRVRNTNEMIIAFKEVTSRDPTNLEWVTLGSAVSEACEILAPLFEDSGVQLKNSANEYTLTVYTSKSFLICILVNLIKNA